MKPLLKWVGGKTQLLDDVLALLPLSIHDYYEPFVGGGSVLLAVLGSGRVTGTVYASDINPRLINLYRCLQTEPAKVARCLQIVADGYRRAVSQESFYYGIRALFNAQPVTGAVAAALFLFLNKTCFRGVYREGPKGFNVPFGHYGTVELPTAESIEAMSRSLAPVVFSCESFETALAKARSGDFVYVDPPYVPETATSFVGYVAGGFHFHTELFTALKALPCGFLMSNSAAPSVLEAFPDPNYKTCQVLARRAIHSKDPSARTMEVLITTSS
jgi:DNA adenine methylase